MQHDCTKMADFFFFACKNIKLFCHLIMIEFKKADQITSMTTKNELQKCANT